MSASIISLLVFACIFGCALLGMYLPGHRLDTDTKDVVRLGTGLIGTISALVLGLLIASAKNSFDTQNSQINQLAANIILLDGLLAQYGPETRTARDLLRREIVTLTGRIWSENSTDRAQSRPFEASHGAESFLEELQALSPANDAQRSLKDRAIQASTELAKTRLLLFTQLDNSIPMPFLAMLIFWLMIIFASFSLFAPPSTIAVSSLFLFALSASGSIFLILELGHPFVGLMQISNEPLRNALAPLG